jgi:hypothetical protein
MVGVEDIGDLAIEIACGWGRWRQDFVEVVDARGKSWKKAA